MPVGIDIETTGLAPQDSKVSLVQVSTEEHTSVVDAFAVNPAPLLDMLAGTDTPAHNAKFEWQHIKHHYGVELNNLKDTMLMEQVLTAGERHGDYSLEAAVRRHLGIELDKGHQEGPWNNRPLRSEQLQYAAKDAEIVLRLYEVLSTRLEEEGLLPIAELENRVVPFTALMELTGVRFDRERWLGLEERARDERLEIEHEMRAIAPVRSEDVGEWNLNSPRDVRRMLEEAGIEELEDTSKKSLETLEDTYPLVAAVLDYKRAKSLKDPGAMDKAAASVREIAPSKVEPPEEWNFDSPQQIHEISAALSFELKDTSASTLSWYVSKHKFFELLVRYRQKGKLVSTYGARWGEDAIRDGRVYPSYHQLGADSGRFSSSAPNIQNIPTRGGYRECFIAEEGYAFVVADYSQIELRVLANQTGDEALLWAFRNEEDPHKVTAMKMAAKNHVEDVTKEERARAKIVNYGISYGLTKHGLPNAAMKHYGVPMSVDEAAAYISAYFKAHPKIKKYQKRVEKNLNESLRKGVGGIDCYTPLGRRRKNVQNKREAFNHPVQGAAADGIKEAMARLYERRHEFPNARPWATLHDSIAYTCPAEEAREVEEWLVSIMVEAMDDVVNSGGHHVPVEVDSYIDNKWRSED